MTHEILSRAALNRALLARQMLLARVDATATEAVGRLVGLQAQQAQPPFVGLWTRLSGFRRDDLMRPIRERAIVRATFLRGTLHLVTADDFRAYRATLQPMLTAGMRAVLRGRAEALDVPALVGEARRVFRERPRTFTELRAALKDLFRSVDERAMGYAVRTHLPLAVVPDGSTWGYPPDPVFADAESWLGSPPSDESRPEALILRYLRAFGPAASSDVTAWSGLGGVLGLLDKLRPQLRVFRDARKRELFDLPDAPRPPGDTPSPVRFLAGFDNLILSHADRSRVIADEHRPRVTTRNLLVSPTFLVDGFVAGTWTADRVKKAARLTVTPFAPLTASARAGLADEGERLARFIDQDAASWAVEFRAP